MNILTVDEITKAYGERKIFDQASFLKKVADYPDASKSSCPSPEKFMDYFEKADEIYIPYKDRRAIPDYAKKYTKAIPNLRAGQCCFMLPPSGKESK